MTLTKILIILIIFLTPCLALAENEITFTPQIPIPGADSSKLQPDGTTRPIGEYISAIYSYAVAVVGILAACTLIIGGLLWLTAGGNAERVTSAKSWIGSSLTGLLLVICSYLLLSMVNPNLVKFQISGIEKPKIQNIQNTPSNNPQLNDPNCDGTVIPVSTQGEGQLHQACSLECSPIIMDYEQSKRLATNDFCCICKTPVEGDSCFNDNDCGIILTGIRCITDQNKCLTACNKCGEGAINICDEIECGQLKNCLFTDTSGPGGTCTAR